jgi:hypothetical protein
MVEAYEKENKESGSSTDENRLFEGKERCEGFDLMGPAD